MGWWTGVLSEVVDRRNGSMARTPYLLEFARLHGLRCITIADLVQYLQMGAQLQAHAPLRNAVLNGASMPLQELNTF